MEKILKSLQNLLKIKFKNKDLLIQAITHKSFNTKKNYEKLEFLGDRVLGIIISPNDGGSFIGNTVIVPSASEE